MTMSVVVFILSSIKIELSWVETKSYTTKANNTRTK